MKGLIFTLLLTVLASACATPVLEENSNENAAASPPANASAILTVTPSADTAPQDAIPLPPPIFENDPGMSLEQALLQRRSLRDYQPGALTLAQAAQLLWSAQGVNDLSSGFRTVPSAGATFPLELYLVAAEVDGIAAGVYRYRPHSHDLELIVESDRRAALYDAALRQSPVREAPVSLVISAIYERTTRRYGERGVRYVHMEAGHAAQNVYLQAASLDLGTVVIGAFDDEGVRRALVLPAVEEPLYILPVGNK